MKKEFRIKKNKEFQEVYKKGNSVANRQFVVYLRSVPEQTHFRVGLSVSKKIGNAVTRNQVKRYIRQALLELQEQMKNDYDLIIIARKPASDMSFHEVKGSLTHVLKLAKVLNGRVERKKEIKSK